MASNAENVSIWWRHHVIICKWLLSDIYYAVIKIEWEFLFIYVSRYDMPLRRATSSICVKQLEYNEPQDL